MGTIKVKMLVSQSGPKISRTGNETYDIDSREAVRLIRSRKGEAVDKKEFEKAEKEFDAAEVKEVEAKKNLATTKLVEAEEELVGLIGDINEAKAHLAEATEAKDKAIKKHSDKAKLVVKLQATVDAEIREQAAKEKEALEKVAAAKAAAEKKSASKTGSASIKKTAAPATSKPKTLSQMNKGELKVEVAKLEGIKAEEIERINKLGNKAIVKEIKAYKAPKTSSDDSTRKGKTTTTTGTAKE